MADLKKLKEILKYAQASGDYYNNLYQGLDIDSIKSLEDFNKTVPFTSKLEFIEKVGENVDIGIEKIKEGVFVRIGTGSTTKYSSFYRTNTEMKQAIERFSKTAFYLNQKKDKKDRVLVVYDFSLAYIFTSWFLENNCIVALGNPYDLNLTLKIGLGLKPNIIRATMPIALKLAQLLVLIWFWVFFLLVLHQ